MSRSATSGAPVLLSVAVQRSPEHNDHGKAISNRLLRWPLSANHRRSEVVAHRLAPRPLGTTHHQLTHAECKSATNHGSAAHSKSLRYVSRPSGPLSRSGSMVV